MALLVLSGLTRRYAPDRPSAVEALSLAVDAGTVLALLGPSGCGKTTTLRLIAGFERPDAGQVAIRGEVVASGDGGRFVPPEGRGVGVVFQDYALFPHLTVDANVGFGLASLPPARRRARVAEALDLVGLAELGARFPHELSGGQQQRVAVARALAPAPALVLLDEPFSNLDADLRAELRDEVGRALRTTASTAVFVTHDQEEAFAIADQVGVLDQGRLVQLDTPETVYHRPASPFVAEFVGAADFLPGEVTPEGIVTELGLLGSPGAVRPGDRVTVMVRPDDVSFVVDPEGPARIARRQFRGSETLYSLSLPSGREVHSSQPSAATFAAGLRVRPEARVLHVVAFPAP